ncbi:MAG: amidase [Pseudomonadota bacterium]
MSDQELCYLSATEALARFKDRSLSPVELLRALIDRADATEPTVNALSHRHFDEAMAKAKKAEARYMTRSGGFRRLEGLPLAVKEDTAIKGKPQTLGSLIFKDRIADHTAPSIERLLGAGAIVHAQTTCPEFVWPWICTSRLHGTTRNPWNPAITSGASSGGSAAALAAGTTTIATGTDSAGSIRMPASMCGVIGYKPPYGRNPQSPDLNLDMFMHLGPMTRAVADAALMQNVMSGHHPLDHASVRGRVTLPLEPESIAGTKIAYSLTLGVHEVADDVIANTLTLVDRLRGLGADVEEVETDWAPEVFAKAGSWGGLIYADDFLDAVERHPDLVCDYTRAFAEMNASVTPRMFHECMKAIGHAWLDVGPMLDAYDVFICPTVATTAIPADGSDLEPCVTVNGQQLEPHDVVMTFYFDAFGRCPTLAVPSGFATDGVPTGVQLVARTFDDARVFRVAHALEQETALYQDSTSQPKLP